MSVEAPDGYDLPFHGSLSETMTIAGCPRDVAIVIATLAGAISFGLQQPLVGAPLGLAAHAAAAALSARDPHFFAAFARHLRLPAYLEA